MLHQSSKSRRDGQARPDPEILCAICGKSVGEKGILSVNPRTGKTAIMHSACLRKKEK